MVLLASIIIGAAFGIAAAKKGFYSSWALLVNITVSVYLALFLAPTILETVPEGWDLAESPYALAGCLAVVAVAAFSILHAIAVIFFTGQFSFSFPRVFNTVGAGLAGFVSGFLVCGFLSLIILAIPIWQDSAFAEQLTEVTELSVVKACNCINFLSGQNCQYSAQDLVRWCGGSEPAAPGPEPEAPPREPDSLESYEFSI